MDIDCFNFWQTLPVVLEAISLSDYVAFDLEMTGVSGQSASNDLEHTEATAYHLAAETARTFQILQFGMTCLAYDYTQRVYRAKTFTFHLTPEFVPPNTALAKVIDRKLVLSYRSFLFLKENNFSFEKAFSQGVPYLSRAEGELAKNLYLSRPRHQDAGCVDAWSREFYEGARRRILAWLGTNPGPGDSILISRWRGRSDLLLPSHVKLIRQLVRTEFPSCFVVFQKHGTHAEVVRWDQNEQQSHDTEFKTRQLSVVRQTAFRYILEALTGSSFASSIDTNLLIDDLIQGPARKSCITRLRANLHLYEARLRKKRPVLIGHNPLLDLCFLQETFLQPLPSDVAAFRRGVGKFFPRVVDTKFLGERVGGFAGCAGGEFRMRMGISKGKGKGMHNLEALYTVVRSQGPAVPVIHEPGFGFDGRKVAAHDAGFDSWITAVVFVSLSWRMMLRWKELLGEPRQQRTDGDGESPSEESGSGSGDELFRELSPFAAGRARAGAGSRAVGWEPIPPWDCEVWRRYGNKLRLGAAGVMDLEQD